MTSARNHLLRLLIPWLLALAAGAPASAQSGDVLVELKEFGVGGAYRPGGYVAVRLQLTVVETSNLGKATPVWVQWEVPNADGDVAEFGRDITLTSGQKRMLWLYAPLPPETDSGAVWPVRVYEYPEGERGRELGGLRMSPIGIRVDPSTAMIGVVGSSQMGLNQLRLAQIGSGVVQTAHEDTRAVFGIRPQDMCDRWEGLKAFEAIAWSGVLPQDLSATQTEALREWVRRGGHLIIALPEDTNPWGIGEAGKTDFEDLLPSRAPRKDEDVPLLDLMPVLSKAATLDPPGASFPVSIRVFRDRADGLDRIDNGYAPLIALPDGRVLAVQRIFGHGRVTLLGIDLANERLARSLPLSNKMHVGLPQADAFWNRILGRRGDTPTLGEILEMEKDGRLIRGAPHEELIGDGRAVRQTINMSGEAGAGLGLALLIFLVYWIAAGPGGFALLKHYKRVHHAWLAFAVTAAVFTAIAWGGVKVIRNNEVTVQHLTFLDHIARPAAGEGEGEGSLLSTETDPQLQRAVSWLSLYMPGYGDTEVEIDSLEASAAYPRQRDLLVSWTPPRDGAHAFPNADRYKVDVGHDPDSFRLPSRSTATQLYANWLGGLDPAWGGLLREDPNDLIRVEDPGPNQVLRGTLINDLPGDLENVTIIWVWSRRVPARKYARQGDDEMPWIRGRTGEMLNIGRMFRVGSIPSGTSYEIPGIEPRARLGDNIYRRYIEHLESRSAMANPGAPLTVDGRRNHLEMLSLYRQLDPPKYSKQPNGLDPDTVMAVRMLGRELDLSPWFNRPCLIVLGYLNDSACPIPLLVDGEPAKSKGLTVVRWILPLPLNESIAFPEESE